MLGDEHGMAAEGSLPAVVCRRRGRQAPGDEVARVIENGGEASLRQIVALLGAEGEPAAEARAGQRSEEVVEIAHHRRIGSGRPVSPRGFVRPACAQENSRDTDPTEETAMPLPPLETTRYEVEDGIATITLHRPEKLNAYNGQMRVELGLLFDETDADDEVKAVIVTGAGRAFCAGADLSSGGDTSVSYTHLTLPTTSRV